MAVDEIIARNYKMLWEEGHLLDYTIKVDNRTFQVHKTILASASDYFRALLTGDMSNSEKEVIELKGNISALAMENIIKYIYTCEMDITQENAAEILSGAVYLQALIAVEACSKYMIDNLDAKNCFDVRSVFLKYALMDKVKEVTMYIKENSQSLVKNVDCDTMSYEDLQTFLDDWKDSEWNLFQYVKSWVEANLDEREQYMNELLCSIRYCLMTPDELEDIKVMELYTMATGDWTSLVCKAVNYYKLPIHLKIMDDSIQSKVRCEQELVCMPGALQGLITPWAEPIDPCICTLRGKSWVKKETAVVPNFKNIMSHVIEINNFLVLGTDMAAQVNKWCVFDPRTLSWHDLTTSPVTKTKFAALTHDGKLYIIGGRTSSGVTNTVEVYNFRTNSWSETTKLPNPVEDHAACVYNNHIYVSGGKETGANIFHCSLHCFDIIKKTWNNKAHMTSPVHGHCMFVMKHDSQDVLYTIDQSFNMQCYDPVSDQWTWCEFPFTPQHPPCNIEEAKVVARGNSVYFLGRTSKHFINMIKSLYLKFTIPVRKEEDDEKVLVEYLDRLRMDRVTEDDHLLFAPHVIPLGAFLAIPPYML